jgi:hypothetical protein
MRTKRAALTSKSVDWMSHHTDKEGQSASSQVIHYLCNVCMARSLSVVRHMFEAGYDSSHSLPFEIRRGDSRCNVGCLAKQCGEVWLR